MAFTTGNLGKELLQNVFRPSRPKSRQLSEIKKPKDITSFESYEKRGLERKHDESLDETNLPFEKYANEKYKCSCHVCNERKGIKSKSEITQKPKTVTLQGNEKGFSYLLKLLIPDRGNAPKGLRFLIADTLVFTSGEPRFLIYNSRDKYIRYIKNKDRLSLREMKTFFLNRKQRKELDGINFYNENTITMSKKIKEARAKIDKEKTSDQLNHSNERPSPSRREKKMAEPTAYKDVVICKYTDESLQVLTELDFSYLMMRRKIEAVWTQTDYIQTYITMKKDHPYYIRVDFDFERDKKSSLYERASNFIYYLVEEREPELKGFDYSTEEDHFEETLKEKNVYEYCQYITYKLVCYLDAYCASRTREMVTEFAWDDANLIYLTNAYKIKFFNLDEVDDYTLKEVHIVNEEEKQKLMERLNQARNSPYQGKIEILWALKQYYEDIKQDTGINKDFEDSIIDNQASNDVFRQLNPEASFTLYDVMTNTKEFEKFKVWLQNRSQDSGTLARLYKSALKYVDMTVASSGTSSNFRSTKSSFIRPEKEKNTGDDDSTKMFVRKLKALDICGNGFSKKKYVHSSEILYRSDVISGRKMVACESNKKLKILGPSPTECSTTIGTSPSKTPNGMAQSRYRIRSQKTMTPQQNFLDQSVFNKTKSLTSILYMKPGTSFQ